MFTREVNGSAARVVGPTMNGTVQLPDLLAYEQDGTVNATQSGMEIGPLGSLFASILAEVPSDVGQTAEDRARRRQKQFANLTDTDTKYERDAWRGTYDAIAAISAEVMTPAFTNAGRTVRDRDLIPERAMARGVETIVTALDGLSEKLRILFLAGPGKRFEGVQNVLVNAVALPVAENYEALRREMRAAEVRALFRDKKTKGEQAAFLNALSLSESYEGLAALADDPMGRPLDREFERSTRTALAHKIDPALKFWLDTEPGLLIGIAGRIDTLVELIFQTACHSVLQRRGNQSIKFNRPDCGRIARAYTESLVADFDLAA
jgi:hypothetical protein